MNKINHLDGIRSRFVETSRLRTYILEAGSADHFPVIFLHGNASASAIWEELMLGLDQIFYCIAPDLRGYGQTDSDQIIDATRGVMNWVDDLEALAEGLNLDKFHLVGHSLGGWICWGAVAELSTHIETVTLMAPGPPHGFGGIQGSEGLPNNPDYSGSGAGVVNQLFIENLRKGVRDSEEPMFSPRAIMHRLFWKDGFKPLREEEILTAMMQIHCGDKQYPGDYEKSTFWPFVAPGEYGPVNALSPKYNTELTHRFSCSVAKPPILWIHGKDDQIISNESLSDPGMQGKLGFRSDWPGEKTYPPQPMIDQIENQLKTYMNKGGDITIEKLENCGHSPFLEQYERVLDLLRSFLISIK